MILSKVTKTLFLFFLNPVGDTDSFLSFISTFNSRITQYQATGNIIHITYVYYHLTRVNVGKGGSFIP